MGFHERNATPFSDKRTPYHVSALQLHNEHAHYKARSFYIGQYKEAGPSKLQRSLSLVATTIMSAWKRRMYIFPANSEQHRQEYF